MNELKLMKKTLTASKLFVAPVTQAAPLLEAIGFIFPRGHVGTGADVTITGVGDYCGGVLSAENYVGFGARNTIGAEGCISGSITSFEALNDPSNLSAAPLPAAFWLIDNA